MCEFLDKMWIFAPVCREYQPENRPKPRLHSIHFKDAPGQLALMKQVNAA